MDSVELPLTDLSPIAGQPFAIQAVALVHPEPVRHMALVHWWATMQVLIGYRYPQVLDPWLGHTICAHLLTPASLLPAKVHNLLVQLLQVHCLYSSFHYKKNKGLTLRRHCFVLAVALCVGGHRSTSSASLSSKGLLSSECPPWCTLHFIIKS